ncbi:MAG: hypothetical protein ACRBBP_01570 [Bdellovibrionales bacterium]
MKKLSSSILFLFFTLSSALAFANIQVFPTRINLSPSEKTATVSIRLRSDKPETFRISTMFYEMARDGSVKQRPDLARSSESAASYIRFSPKRVELRPNVEQVVRIRVRNIAKLKNEVRTHLYFRPSEAVNHDPIKKNIGTKSAFELKAQIAVAVPIIITPRPIKKDFSLSKFKLFIQDNSVNFKVDLTKKTTGFLYGDVKVFKVKGSKKTLVGTAKGISSYIKQRSVSYPLVNSVKNPLTKGRYRLEFNEYSQVKPEKGTLKSIDYVYK